MALQDTDKFFKLAQVCNSTFGTGGPGETNKFVAEKVSYKAIDENTLSVLYATLVLFPNHPPCGIATHQVIKDIKDQYRKEAKALLQKTNKEFAAEYKDRFDGEKISLSFTEKSVDDDVEFISYHVSVSVNRAFYRFRAEVKVK